MLGRCSGDVTSVIGSIVGTRAGLTEPPTGI
jgi:hypothetical protein